MLPIQSWLRLGEDIHIDWLKYNLNECNQIFIQNNQVEKLQAQSQLSQICTISDWRRDVWCFYRSLSSYRHMSLANDSILWPPACSIMRPLPLVPSAPMSRLQQCMQKNTDVCIIQLFCINMLSSSAQRLKVKFMPKIWISIVVWIWIWIVRGKWRWREFIPSI